MSTTIPPLVFSTDSKPDNQLVRFGASLRSPQKENVWTPRIVTQPGHHPQNVQGFATPNTAFYLPSSWVKEYTILTRRLLEKDDFIALHKNKLAYQLKGKIKLAFYVQAAPPLSSLKTAIPTENNCANYDALWNALYIPGAKDKERKRVEVRTPSPVIWAVTSTEKSVIIVLDSLSGSVLLRFTNCKSNVGISCITHAPFLGFIDKQLNVIPLKQSADILPLKEENLIETDYMWVGFADGAIRLFPANHEKYYKISGKTKEDSLVDVVFEVPKFHAGAIVSIARSPSLPDADKLELCERTRLSTIMKYLSGISASEADDNVNSSKEREHLSIVCTASVDSVVVVWDLKTIYKSLQGIREMEMEKQNANLSYLSSVDCAQDLITIERIGCPKELSNISSQSSTQTKCILVNARPLLRLKGGVTGLTCLSWVSSVVTTEGYRPEREAALATRDPRENSASDTLKSRRSVQTATRFDRREGQRRILELSEEEMLEVERELRILLPPLAQEKLQSKRVNLLLAGDSTGSVHIWDLDEELRRRSAQKGVRDLSQSTVGQTGPLETFSVLTSAPDVPDSKAKGNAYIQTAPVHTQSATQGKKSVRKGKAKSRLLPRGYISAAAPNVAQESHETAENRTEISSINLGSARLRGRSLRMPTGKSTPRLSRLQLLAAERSGRVPEKLRILDSSVQSSTKVMKRRSVGNTTTRRNLSSSAMVNLKESMEASTAFPNQNLPSSVELSQLVESSLSFDSSFPKSSLLSLLPTPGVRDHQKLGRSLTSRRTVAGGSSSTILPSFSFPSSRSFVTSSRHAEQAPLSPLPISPSSNFAPLGLSQKKSVTRRTGETRLKGVTSSQSDVTAQKSIKKRRLKVSSVPTVVRKTVPKDAPEISVPKSSLTVPVTSHSKDPTLSHLPAKTSSDVVSRVAKCRIEFTGGGAVLGMAVQVPSEICVTMRRIPNPIHREISLLESPSAEEMEQRSLENSFTELSDTNALFFVFQYLQLHLCVEGAVLDFRFTPQWKEKDPDGKELFINRDFSDVARKMEHPDEVILNRFISLSSFDVHIRKLVLDAHSQSVSAFYFNRDRQHLWVGRNDGLLSVFSTANKYIVSRVPHPSATDALGPPDPIQWARQLRSFLRESRYMKGAKKLEKHKETLSYGDGRFTGFVPFCRKAESSFALIYHSQECMNDENTGSEQSLRTFSARTPGRRHAQAEIFHMDGRGNLSTLDRKHERHLNVFLNYLKLCRSNADKVRQASRSFYYSERVRINKLIDHMDSYMAGRLSDISLLRKSLGLWRVHHEHFPFQHYCLRLQNEKDKTRKRVAVALLHLDQKEKCSRYYFKWRMWLGTRKVNMFYTSIARMTRMSHQRLKSPSEKMLSFLKNMKERKEIFRAWKQRTLHNMTHKSAPLVLSPTRVYRRKNERDRTPQEKPRQVAPNSALHSPDKSFKNIPLDDHTYRFLLLISFVYQSRCTLQFFCNLPESIGESWAEVLDNAESASASEDAHDKKLAVLCYGLLPLLQGVMVISSELASDTCPSAAQVEEVLSMLRGMQLCLDYIVEDPEESIAQLIISKKVAPDSYEENKTVSDSKGDLLLFCRDTAVRGIFHYLLLSLAQEDDNTRVMREISQKSDELIRLLTFALNPGPH